VTQELRGSAAVPSLGGIRRSENLSIKYQAIVLRRDARFQNINEHILQNLPEKWRLRRFATQHWMEIRRFAFQLRFLPHFFNGNKSHCALILAGVMEPTKKNTLRK
jgi:hypothetical protein